MSIFCLVDANNFYVSCQRVFDPKIRFSPVGVLSNNDGCIIARSDELKKLLPMGVPVFKARNIIERKNVQLFSSCYPLYHDFSLRVANTLSEFTPAMENYSIDESFLEFDEKFDITSDSALTEKGWMIKERVKKVTGIPVSVGFGETKTLAKLANRLAKKSFKARGVLDLFRSPFLSVALERTDIGDVWNVGSESVKKLRDENVFNALEFSRMPIKKVRNLLTVKGARTALELRGVSCIPLETVPITKKAISCSRSFGNSVTTLRGLKEAIAFFLARAVEKLRKNNLSAKSITVFISTDSFDQHNYYGNSSSAKFIYASDLLVEHQERAFAALSGIYRQGFEYKRAGVILSDLVPAKVFDRRMLDGKKRKNRFEKFKALMSVVDEVNEKHGRDKLRFAVSNPSGIWQMKQLKKSPHFTTRFEDILVID